MKKIVYEYGSNYGYKNSNIYSQHTSRDTVAFNIKSERSGIVKCVYDVKKNL